ncbi:MAG TPA: hypothetical protein VNH15_07745 [Elusimicrobiota bacterium]|nr:hypothetical protein [Elusimicrobiota bacterium]
MKESTGAKVFLAIAIAFSALFLAEIAARVMESKIGSYYYIPMYMGAWGPKANQPSPIFGWEHVPGAYDFNSLGFVNPEYPIKKGSGVYRIMLIGDSLAEGYGPELLNQINAKYSGKRKIEVWDLGVGAYNIAQIARTLRYRGLHYNPDIVILFICPIEIEPGEPTMYKTGGKLFMLPWDGNKPRSLAFGLLWRHSALYRLSVLKYLDITLSRKPHPLPDRFTFGLDQMAAIKNECAAAHVPLVAFLFPYLMPFSQYTERERNDYLIWKMILKHLDVRYFDLTPMLDGRMMEKMRNKPKDYIHFDTAGRVLSMRLVHNILLRNHYLP